MAHGGAFVEQDIDLIRAIMKSSMLKSDRLLACIIHEPTAAEADLPASTALPEEIPAQRTDSTSSREFPRAPCIYKHFHSLARAFMNNPG
jgi:hypothetical protein